MGLAKKSSDTNEENDSKPFLSSNETFPLRTKTHTSKLSLVLIILISVVIGTTLGLTPYLLNKPIQSHRPKTIGQPCGNTSAEARSRGCHFDVISFCWLPTTCYDAELSADFEAKHHLEWYLDPNRTQPVMREQVMTGEYSGLYVNWEYHLAHCTAMWKKMHRAIMGGLGPAGIDSYIGSYHHTRHCEVMLLGGQVVALDAINTRIKVKFPDCGMDYSRWRTEGLDKVV